EACRIAGIRERLKPDRGLRRQNRCDPAAMRGLPGRRARCTFGPPQGGRTAAPAVTKEARCAMMKETSMRGTVKRLWLVAGLVAVSIWPGVAVAASSITGAVTFDGKVP